MDTAVAGLGWVLFGAAIVVGMGLNLLGLFGNWIILAAMLGLWALTGFVHFGWIGIGGLVAVAVLGEILEMAASGYGAKRFGGSKGSVWAALAGTLMGAVLGSGLFPIIGTIIGACAGAFAAAAFYEFVQHEKGFKQAAWTGVGAALGKIGGMLAKFMCGLIMLGVGYFTYS